MKGALQLGGARTSAWTAFGLGSILGALVFLRLWGWEPLNVNSSDWLVHEYGSDPSFVAIGTLRFLRENWHWPLGVIDGLVYPSRTSVIYTDSIPILAIFAKILHSIFGVEVQYFGIWGLFCMMLQGGISAAIIYRYCETVVLSVVGASFS